MPISGQLNYLMDCKKSSWDGFRMSKGGNTKDMRKAINQRKASIKVLMKKFGY